MENNMDANVKDANSQNESLEKDYKNGFIKNVHHIGRVTMLFALLLSFAPILYFILVKGYTLPIEIYLGGIAGVFSIGIGMWLTEPEAYWPVLGSAGTYISYLSGNVGAMRFPVASTVQKDMKADVSTPRGANYNNCWYNSFGCSEFDYSVTDCTFGRLGFESHSGCNYRRIHLCCGFYACGYDCNECHGTWWSVFSSYSWKIYYNCGSCLVCMQ